MSVMPCSRAGCVNILCDRYSDVYGYICTECYEELVNSNRVDIYAFMKQTISIADDVPNEFYKKIFVSL